VSSTDLVTSDLMERALGAAHDWTVDFADILDYWAKSLNWKCEYLVEPYSCEGKGLISIDPLPHYWD